MGRRLVIEASSTQKLVLDLFLQDTGTSLNDWFSDRVAEATALYSNATSSKSGENIVALSDLADSRQVFDRLLELDWSFTEADTGYLTHNIHPYPAKFVPQIPRQLLLSLSVTGEVVWDPFGGSGTTALEALLTSRRAISSDVNPVATIIGTAKTVSLAASADADVSRFVTRTDLLGRERLATEEMLERHSKEFRGWIPSIPNINKWFHPNAVRELGYVRWQIERLSEGSVRHLALGAFSKIIFRASFQDAETRYASKPRDVPVGYVLRMFAAELDSARARARATSAALQFRSADFRTADIRTEPVVAPGSVDLIITSPPYPNATDYHLYHRFRLYWLGFSPQDVGKREIGSHLRHQKERSGVVEYMAEMSVALRRMYEGLRPGRYAVLVVGSGVFDGELHRTDRLLAHAAAEIGFEVLGTIDRPVHGTKRSFSSAARRLQTEQLLVLRHPRDRCLFRLHPPPYRLWPYEKRLRFMEVEHLLGSPPHGSAGDVLTIEAESLAADKLRRLTFSHGFSAEGFAQERTWQAVLENGDAVEHRRRKDPKYATHGLHSYKGKFYPQLARSLFNIAGLGPRQLILDPFCGSGTVPLEAKLNGLNSKGIDLNPLAARIAQAKVRILSADPTIVDRLLSDTLEAIAASHIKGRDPGDVFPAASLNELCSWFPQPVLRKLAQLVEVIDEVSDLAVNELLTVCLSNVVREVSQQDPKDLRIRRRKEPIADAPVFELFARQVGEQRVRLRQLAERTIFSPGAFGEAEIFHDDCRKAEAYEASGIRPGTVDAVVTSPPYATALPYIDTDRLSLLLLLGMRTRDRAAVEYDLTGSREISSTDRRLLELRIAAGDFDNIESPTAQETIQRVFRLNANSNVGFRRKNQASLLYRYYRDISSVMGHLDRVVRPGGSLFFVIGDNLTTAGGKEVAIRSTQILREMGERRGWTLRATIPITVTKEARPHHRNSITDNDIIWLQRI